MGMNFCEGGRGFENITGTVCVYCLRGINAKFQGSCISAGIVETNYGAHPIASQQKQDDEEDAETLRDDGPKSCFLP